MFALMLPLLKEYGTSLTVAKESFISDDKTTFFEYEQKLIQDGMFWSVEIEKELKESAELPS